MRLIASGEVSDREENEHDEWDKKRDKNHWDHKVKNI